MKVSFSMKQLSILSSKLSQPNSNLDKNYFCDCWFIQLLRGISSIYMGGNAVERVSSIFREKQKKKFNCSELEKYQIMT